MLFTQANAGGLDGYVRHMASYSARPAREKANSRDLASMSRVVSAFVTLED